ncbi:MAG: hypothetical protein KatS3mg065_1158 [Chloroflexota bacterium]|nr:MAG: hypothetical protein KatS3mg065_1158 [Chloroflexota bacterium]
MYQRPKRRVKLPFERGLCIARAAAVTGVAALPRSTDRSCGTGRAGPCPCAMVAADVPPFDGRREARPRPGLVVLISRPDLAVLTLFVTVVAVVAAGRRRRRRRQPRAARPPPSVSSSPSSAPSSSPTRSRRREPSPSGSSPASSPATSSGSSSGAARMPTSGSVLGWPVEAVLALAGGLVGWASHGLGAPGRGPEAASALGVALVVLSAAPVVLGGRDVLRVGIGLTLLLSGAFAVRVGLAGTPGPAEQIVLAGLTAGLGAAVAILVRNAVGARDEGRGPGLRGRRRAAGWKAAAGHGPGTRRCRRPGASDPLDRRRATRTADERPPLRRRHRRRGGRRASPPAVPTDRPGRRPPRAARRPRHRRRHGRGNGDRRRRCGPRRDPLRPARPRPRHCHGHRRRRPRPGRRRAAGHAPATLAVIGGLGGALLVDEPLVGLLLVLAAGIAAILVVQSGERPSIVAVGRRCGRSGPSSWPVG